MNDFVNNWEDAVDSLEQNDEEVIESSSDEVVDSAENLFEAARW